jgi:GT2 family glycosyltransferase
MIERDFRDVILLRGDGNLWWTGATNLGVAHALDLGATLIMTLNDDTIAPPEFLATIVASSANHPNALLGAFAIDAVNGHPVFGGERINWRVGSSVALLDIISPEDRQGLHAVTHFPGRGLLIPRNVFLTIGLFDQIHFPHYAADYDFTHRAIRAGFHVFCNFDAKLFVHPRESGDAQLRHKKSLSNYFLHLFGMKGGGNVKVFTRYAIRNCPPRYLAWFLFRGYVQRIVGYWIGWKFKKKKCAPLLIANEKT